MLYYKIGQTSLNNKGTCFSSEFYQALKEQIIPMLFKDVQHIAKNGKLLGSFCNTCIGVTPNLTKTAFNNKNFKTRDQS